MTCEMTACEARFKRQEDADKSLSADLQALQQTMRDAVLWLKIASAVATLVGTIVVAHASVTVAYADTKIAAIVDSHMRQQSEELFKSREAELAKLAEMTATKAVRLVTVPQDRITGDRR
jgi:hypothetical protein